MKKTGSFFKQQWRKLLLALICLVVVGGIAGGYYAYWYYQQPKFHDVTIELGITELSIEDFYTEYANPKKTAFVTDPMAIDYEKLGDQSIVLRQGEKEETVTLTIQDTTPPEAEFRDLAVSIDYVPSAEEFVVSSYDLTDLSFSFASPLEVPTTYGDAAVEIIVSDTSGNKTIGKCTVSYVWMREMITIELGQELTRDQILFNPEKDADLIQQEDLDAINHSPVGEYVLKSTEKGKTLTCTIVIEDTTGPVITLRPVTVFKGESAALEDFLESITDLSGETTVQLSSELDFNTPGEQTVKVTGKDIYGNQTVAETTLTVTADTTPPVMQGLFAMTVAKGSSPDYVRGVLAEDERDGRVSFTYDASGVNTSVAGTYQVIYKATDSAGNTATYSRVVNVDHDAEDTAKAIADAAAKCGNSPMEIRNYVHDTIAYTSNWGGTDPVWQGFMGGTGNCYVHAYCLQALLSYKGYSTQLIWTTNQYHYWVIVDMGGYWRHIDATPSSYSGPSQLMTDSERRPSLAGLSWDTSAWPACE